MMEDSKADKVSIGIEHFKNYAKFKETLTHINSKETIELRLKLAEAISNCDDGKELSVIFAMHIINDDHLLSIYSRIYEHLQEELAKIGQYNIEPYESVCNGLPLNNNEIILCVYPSNSEDVLNATYNIINVLSRSKQFSNVQVLKKNATNRNTIKCVHNDTGLVFYIDSSKPYDLHNSEFVSQLKYGDETINQLMMFLKIWFRTMFIYRIKYISKYCLMNLIIFYLQNSNPPVLAPLKTIQETAQKKIINFINFGVNTKCIFMNPTQNIQQMIKGFFEFYNSMDFEKVIIAPYLGKVIKKDDFQNKLFKYPEYYAQVRILAATSGATTEELQTHYPLCVQDMFYLNRNIATKNVSVFDVEYLKKCIAMAYKKCCAPNMSIKNLYKSLLINIIEELNQEFNTTSPLEFEIIPLKKELISLVKFADQPINLRKLWTKAYIAAIPQIIFAVYKIDMVLLPPPTENFIFKKLEQTEELPLPFKWSISSTVDLWTRRDWHRSNSQFMQLELAKTEDLYAKRRNKLTFAVQFHGFITITITEKFNSLHIEVSSNETPYSKNNNHLRKFFGSFRSFMEAYNLSHRIDLLESQLQTKM